MSATRRGLAALSAGAILAVLGGVIAATPASASYFTQTLRDRATGRCLDDSLRYGLRAYPCNGEAFQAWYIVQAPHTGAPIWTVRNKATGRCVDDSGAYGLRAYACNASSFQQWETGWTNPAEFHSVNTKRCLDDSVYGLRAIGCNHTNHQIWTMTP